MGAFPFPSSLKGFSLGLKVLGLTTCSFHKLHTTSQVSGVSRHRPVCKLEMQKSWKHRALPGQMHPASYFILISQLHFPLCGTPGSELPSPSLSPAMLLVAPQILTSWPTYPYVSLLLPLCLPPALQFAQHCWMTCWEISYPTDGLTNREWGRWRKSSSSLATGYPYTFTATGCTMLVPLQDKSFLETKAIIYHLFVLCFWLAEL